MGGQVRKGEKATHVLFYKFDDEREKAPASAPDTPASSPDGTAERDSSRPPMVRCYAVFNVEQDDGLTLERPGDERWTLSAGQLIGSTSDLLKELLSKLDFTVPQHGRVGLLRVPQKFRAIRH